MNKKLYFTVMILSGILMLSACSGPLKKPVDLKEFFITMGVALTHDMDELAESKEYISLMSASDTLGKVIDRMASQDYSAPENAYLLKLPDDVLVRAMQNFPTQMNISVSVMEKLRYKISGSVFASKINAGYGAEMIAAASVTSWGKSYIQPEGWSENMVLLLEYKGEFSSIVSFMQSGEGVISGSSVFVKNGDKDILTIFNNCLNTSGIEYEHYTGSQLKALLGA